MFDISLTLYNMFDMSLTLYVQPVPDEMRLEMVIGMDIRIVSAKYLGLSSHKMFVKRLKKILQDSDFSFDKHFSFRLLGHGR